MKGFVEVAGKPMRLLVQGVGQRVETRFERPWEAGQPRRSELVVIGRKGMDRDAVSRILRGEA